MKAIKIYTDRHAYVRVPVDEHWISIAQTVRDLVEEWRRDFPEDSQEKDDNHPWSRHWEDMMQPRYYAHECVMEILGPDADFDFDICNDYMDLEDTLEALLDGREDAGLVELELEMA